jgi:hypothetical protein
MDEDDCHVLQRLAVAAMRDGRLPASRPDRILGGHGSGSLCDLCSRELAAGGSELEVEFTAASGGASRCYHLHVRCFAVWEHAREKI